MFVALIPAKPPHLGKQRLNSLPADQRIALATAFTLDTLRAVRDCELVSRVYLISTDPQLGMSAAGLGVDTLLDPAPDPLPGPRGFNDMLRAAAQEVVAEADQALMVVPGDLPALTPHALAEALGRWLPHRPAFVPDRAGTGSTLYVALANEFDPRYGPGSRAAHLASGAQELAAADCLRQDVDHPGDLEAAFALGVGPHTAAALGSLTAQRGSAPLGAPGSAPLGTVSTPVDRGGTVTSGAEPSLAGRNRHPLTSR
jgi:2-phospho-L-lactate/phosphoenolpyruvate guanylyltransferase